MKKLVVSFLAVLLMALGVAWVSAAGPVPNVQVYFTSDYGAYGKAQIPECPPNPPGTVFDSLYVVANNFNCYISAIEYQVSYPPQIIWLGDDTGTGLNIGSSPTGIATAWPFPQNAFVPYAVNKVKFIYNCQLCYDGNNIPITVLPNPGSGYLRFTQWPSNTLINAIGMVSLICPTIPVEETTWGNIKAIYNK